jgi:hypothetical protein
MLSLDQAARSHLSLPFDLGQLCHQDADFVAIEFSDLGNTVNLKSSA